MQTTLTQRHFFTRTVMTIEPNGVAVAETGLNKQLQFVVPFETIPSTRFFARSFRKWAIILAMFFGVFGAIVFLLSFSPEARGDRVDEWLLSLGCFAIPGLILWFTREEFVGFGLPSGGFIIPASSPSRAQVQAFLDALHQAKLAYLREVYLDKAARVPPDEELRRLLWLKEQGVLTPEEFDARRRQLDAPTPAGVMGFAPTHHP